MLNGLLLLFQKEKEIKNKNCCQHRIKLIASYSLLTKVLADFLFVIYLLTLVLKTRNKSYTNTLPTIAEITQTELIWELKCGFLNR
jgi:hypothetical protein